jgi:hypothetical protein
MRLFGRKDPEKETRQRLKQYLLDLANGDNFDFQYANGFELKVSSWDHEKIIHFPQVLISDSHYRRPLDITDAPIPLLKSLIEKLDEVSEDLRRTNISRAEEEDITAKDGERCMARINEFLEGKDVP